MGDDLAMAFGDWTFYNQGTTVLNLIDTPTPPAGTRWLHFDSKNPDVGTATMIAVPRNPPYPYQGVTRGYLRTLLRYGTSGYRSRLGLSCMCSSENMNHGVNGRASYSVMLENGSSSGPRTMQLCQWSQGMAIGAGVTLALAPNNLWSFNTTFALELSWYLDLPTLNGIVLSVRMGVAPDYSDLAPVPNLYEVLSTSNVLTNAAAVNVFVDSAGTPNLHVYFDQTSLGTL